MQNQNTDRTQKPVIPKVRYHPSIQTPGARTSEAQRTGPAASPPQADRQTRQTRQTGPAVRPRPDGGQRRNAQKPVNKPGLRAAPSPPPDRAPPTPEEVPLGLGLDRCVVKQVEVLTRGQRTNPAWFTWRKNRITASVAHRIAHCRFVNGKSKTPPTSYLAAITGEGRSLQTRAMSWGVQMEAEAVRRYQRLKSAALGRPVSVQDCGLFVDAERSWLAASPDGIVTDGQGGRWLLEVKCPHKHRDKRVEDACRVDPNFCLEIQDEDGQSPVYRLKTSHSYYTQVQVQLAVTGLQRADFAVFTLKETAVVPVTFDPDLWEDTLSKLETFYRDAVLPHLRQRTRQDAAAAWTPEP